MYSDTFVNSHSNIFALSNDGQFLAVSFEEGSLSVFNTTDSEYRIDITRKSNFFHLEGGFSGNILAFSAMCEEFSVFTTFDIQNMEEGYDYHYSAEPTRE